MDTTDSVEVYFTPNVRLCDAASSPSCKAVKINIDRLWIDRWIDTESDEVMSDICVTNSRLSPDGCKWQSSRGIPIGLALLTLHDSV